MGYYWSCILLSLFLFTSCGGTSNKVGESKGVNGVCELLDSHSNMLNQTLKEVLKRFGEPLWIKSNQSLIQPISFESPRAEFATAFRCISKDIFGYIETKIIRLEFNRDSICVSTTVYSD